MATSSTTNPLNAAEGWGEAEDWGAAGARDFVPTQHHEPNATLDVTKVQLPAGFTVCVVGASRGIGAGVAVSYARAGASAVVLAARRISGLEATAARCREANAATQVEIVPCDIAAPAAVQALAAEVRARVPGGRLDVVVVNSGFAGPVVLKVTDTDPETFAQATNVNYVGTFLCAKYLIPLLLETPGGARAFIGIGSLAAMLVRGPIANAQYCVSKTAQLKLMEHIHEQFAGQGLAAYTVHPGAVQSEMAEATPEVFKKFLIDSPDLAGAFCVWLSKDGDKRAWLSGRQLNACWDADELEARKDEIIGKDLLKLKLSV